MGYYNEGHTDGCRTNRYCPGCEKEDRLEVLREVRDYLEAHKEAMVELGGNHFYGYTEDILEIFGKGGRFDCEDGR